MHDEGHEAGVSAPLTGTPTRVHMRGPAVADQVATVRTPSSIPQRRTGSPAHPATTSRSLFPRRARTL